jgi:hypothetical protein
MNIDMNMDKNLDIDMDIYTRQTWTRKSQYIYLLINVIFSLFTK